MRLLLALLWLAVAGGGISVAEDVPLPRPRPPLWIEPQSFREAAGPDFNSADVTGEPTECDKRILTTAVVEPLPRLIGPGACGGGDMRAQLQSMQRDVGSLSDHATYLTNKITFLLDAMLGVVNIQQNNIIKIFSVAAVVFMPPTLIASIYGMCWRSVPGTSTGCRTSTT